MPKPLPAPVGLAHRAVEVEDQLVQSAVLGSAINPLPRHVHQGLSLRFLGVVGICVSNRLTCLRAGRSRSWTRLASLSPRATGGQQAGCARSARARNHCAHRHTGSQAASGTPRGVDGQALGVVHIFVARQTGRSGFARRNVIHSADVGPSPTCAANRNRYLDRAARNRPRADYAALFTAGRGILGRKSF